MTTHEGIMRQLVLLGMLVLSVSCNSKHTKGTFNRDAFSEPPSFDWNGWFEGVTSTAPVVDVTLNSVWVGQPKTTFTAVFSSSFSGKDAFTAEASIPWRIKDCKELELKVGQREVIKIAAVWEGKTTEPNTLTETIKSEIPPKAFEGLLTGETVAIRACGSVASSTTKQKKTLTEWWKAASKPPFTQTDFSPKSNPVSAPSK